MNIVLITTGSRPELLKQTIESMILNASDFKKHTLTIVMDGIDAIVDCCVEAHTGIINWKPQGASASRNIGAGSIPKYRRQKFIMFCDDDCYFCPGWDRTIERALIATQDDVLGYAISGHQHPYNHSDRKQRNGDTEIDCPLLISSVHMVMRWDEWDDVGYFVEPGGPGGSEDYDWCMRAQKEGVAFGVTVPMCVIHCGLISSSGKQIVGYEEMVKQNESLIKQYGLEGKVIWK